MRANFPKHVCAQPALRALRALRAIYCIIQVFLVVRVQHAQRMLRACGARCAHTCFEKFARTYVLKFRARPDSRKVPAHSYFGKVRALCARCARCAARAVRVARTLRAQRAMYYKTQGALRAIFYRIEFEVK